MDNVRTDLASGHRGIPGSLGWLRRSEERLQRWLESPSFDPSLWVIAWDGDEVAAGNVNAIEAEENAALGIKRGWLHSVFTRRQWRKRGLANALIAHSLQLMKERGMDYGILGVDADNPTGALGLYERNGFSSRSGQPPGASRSSLIRTPTWPVTQQGRRPFFVP